MCDKQSVAGKALVPTCTLAVVHEIELVSVLLVVDDVCFAVFAQRLHICNDGVGLKLHGCGPSCHPALEASEVGWAESVAVVASLVEKVP